MTDDEANESFDGPIVLVLGLTGAGKTTFINHITKSNFAVGHGMDACTTTAYHAIAKIDGVNVAFVDTPGFDDPEKSDADVLIDVTTWIDEHLGGKRQVTAALYLHSINKQKMHGSAFRNFNMFSKLIGSKSMKNVGLVSTHWDAVPTTTAEDREAFLTAKSWSLMIAAGARIYRLKNDYHSCHLMSLDLLKAQPTFIKIQMEMAKEFGGKPLSRTEVGQDVYRELQERIADEQSKIKEMEEQLAKGDFEVPGMKIELEKELEKSKKQLARYERDRERVEKVPTWTEAVLGFGKRHGPSVASFLATQAIQNYRGNAILQASQNQVAALTAELAAKEAVEGGPAQAGIGVAILMGAGAVLGKMLGL